MPNNAAAEAVDQPSLDAASSHRAPPPLSPEERTFNRNVISAIVLAILLWGGLLGLGAFLFQGEHDYRKPLIVMACVGGFVISWGALLFFRKRRSE